MRFSLLWKRFEYFEEDLEQELAKQPQITQIIQFINVEKCKRLMINDNNPYANVFGLFVARS